MAEDKARLGRGNKETNYRSGDNFASGKVKSGGAALEIAPERSHQHQSSVSHINDGLLLED